MSQRKELQFFTRDDWREQISWYADRFSTAAAVRGEASPVYTMHPAFPSPASRIRELIPEVKLIYLVRDPIERLVAHYVEGVALGIESRSLERLLADDGSRTNVYICSSLYTSQIEQYLEHFPREQLLVLDHHDLLMDRHETLRRTFSFLGIDPSFTSPSFERTFNRRGEKLRLNALGVAVRRRGWQARLQRAPRRMRPLVTQLITRRVTTPEVNESTRAWLAELFADEMQRLRVLTGQRFSSWSA